NPRCRWCTSTALRAVPSATRVPRRALGLHDRVRDPTILPESRRHRFRGSTDMKPRSDGFPATRLVAALALVWSVTIGVVAASGSSATTASATHAAAPPPATDPAQAGNFVGEETCVTCHESEGKSIHATLHGKAQNVRTPAGRTAGQSCETCHGPGQKHVDSGRKEDIRRFNTLSARDQ